MFSIAVSSVSSVTSASGFTRPELTVILYDGYYTCLDGDTLENDIVASAWIYIDSPYVYNTMDLYIWLTTPDGLEYSYALNIVTYSTYGDCYFFIDLIFYNHALDPGNYRVETLGDLYGDRFYVYNSIIFDPPGGKPGALPDFGWLVY